MSRLLFSIPSYAYLEPAILAAGNFQRGETERKYFPDGERYLRILTELWGRDVVVLGGTPTDVDWLEVFDLASGIARAGARSLAIVMPYFGYATMERAVRPGEVVVAKSRARLLSSIPAPEGGTRVFLFDLHTDGIEFYLDDRVLTRHIYGAPLVTKKIQERMGATPFVLGACDAGRAKWVQSLARDLGVEPAFVYKRRDPASGSTAVTGVNADVRGREVVVYDDMIRTGSSLIQAGKAYLAAGATKVHAIASHLVLPGDALDKLHASNVFASIMGTDSHPGSQKLPKADIVSIAPRLVECIDAVGH
ncbi:Ribose-phosphate pyrophosphokinase [Labilithrix luteola]|uniref:ribose-phosphate diphosphokinase n=1 Tax=Labilithrix luteola TaxID=1391654 RepID=A0A0K1Q5T4_9BACT|nr:ribose-phosphate diphosphokinase [Labilithrix luteola]AKV01022.1 Ribose-phosphate pyrophosphokinase [Labilithrix luteola]